MRLRTLPGSSPLTRGTLSTSSPSIISKRFIPAYAGNSVTTSSVIFDTAVHPRLRGELNPVDTMNKSISGSSPLTRGTRFDKHAKSRNKTVHPRLRGELPIHRVQQNGVCGSSPLTRGTPGGWFIDETHGRFIPAYAGNSFFSVWIHAGNSVHPRLRGELLLMSWLQRETTGSSPLTRGTRYRPSPASPQSRFIPAYAGNSCRLRYCAT